jgi:hypothetical protein
MNDNKNDVALCTECGWVGRRHEAAQTTRYTDHGIFGNCPVCMAEDQPLVMPENGDEIVDYINDIKSDAGKLIVQNSQLVEALKEVSEELSQIIGYIQQDIKQKLDDPKGLKKAKALLSTLGESK